MPYKPPIPYAKRILHFCERSGIDVPAGFHTRSAYKFAVVDTVSRKLVAATWSWEQQVIAFVERASQEGRSFQILDFKHGREMRYVGGSRLELGESFEHRAPSERSAV